tara:strand:- start:16062 stop:16688 length:627 start_codon:yes stop_codon:yes gene_type:complete
MGQLSRLPLEELVHKYKPQFFIETGLGDGSGMKYITEGSPLHLCFERIFSIEIIEEQVDKLKKELLHPRLEFIAGESAEVFKELLPRLKGNIMFWLDAHYPGADIGCGSYDGEENEKVRLPLEEELNLIKNLRPKDNRDIIMMDDLILYKDCGKNIGDFFHQQEVVDKLTPRGEFSELNFFEKIFQDTHDFELNTSDTYYGFLKPKEK